MNLALPAQVVLFNFCIPIIMNNQHQRENLLNYLPLPSQCLIMFLVLIAAIIGRKKNLARRITRKQERNNHRKRHQSLLREASFDQMQHILWDNVPIRLDPPIGHLNNGQKESRYP